MGKRTKAWAKTLFSRCTALALVLTLALPAVLTASLAAEPAVHRHSFACYEQSAWETCGAREDAGHLHENGCFQLLCGDPEHAHTYGCLALACGLEETPPHFHSLACYTAPGGLPPLCGLREGEPEHVHSEECTPICVLACGREEHVHTVLCTIDPEPGIMPIPEDEEAEEPEAPEVLEDVEIPETPEISGEPESPDIPEIPETPEPPEEPETPEVPETSEMPELPEEPEPAEPPEVPESSEVPENPDLPQEDAPDNVINASDEPLTGPFYCGMEAHRHAEENGCFATVYLCRVGSDEEPPAPEVPPLAFNGVAAIVGPDGRIVNQGFLSLESAVKQSVTGQTVVLGRDVKENINIVFTLGKFDQNVVIDLNGHTVSAKKSGIPVFSLSGNTSKKPENTRSITIKNGTISGGSAPNGGGIYAKDTLNITLDHITVTGNTSTESNGGGMYVSIYGNAPAANVTIQHCTFTENSSGSGGRGGSFTIAGKDITSQISISDTVVSENTGGGICLNVTSIAGAPPVSLDRVTIAGNYAAATNSAALHMDTKHQAEVRISNSTISGNNFKSTSSASGIVRLHKGSYIFENCDIVDNGHDTQCYSIVNSSQPDTQVTFINGRISGNIAAAASAIFCKSGGSALTIDGTVITGNSTTKTDSDAAAVHVSGNKNSTPISVRFSSGALYGNTALDGSANDMLLQYAEPSILPANQMADGALASDYFSRFQYTWSHTVPEKNDHIERSLLPIGTGIENSNFSADSENMYCAVPNAVPSPIAAVNGAEYAALSAAVSAAGSGDTIQILENTGCNPDAVPVSVAKTVTLDLNGQVLSGAGDPLFTVDGGALTLIGGGLAEQGIALKHGALTLGDGVDIAQAVDFQGGVFLVNGTHSALRVSLGKDCKLTAGEGFRVDELVLSLDESSLADLAAGNAVAVMTGFPAGGVLPAITLSNGTDLTIRAAADESGTVYLKAGTPSAVYANGSSGSDGNDGLFPDSPVKTFQRAAAVLAGNPTLDTIFITGTLSPSGSETWTLPADKQLVRASGFRSELVSVGSGAELTLQDITIDGAGGSVQAEGPLVRVSGGGNLIVNSGAVLQNNRNVSRPGGGVCIDAGGAAVLNGGTIAYNEARLGGGGIYVNGSLTIPGDALFTDNKALYGSAISSSPSADLSLYANAVSIPQGQNTTSSGAKPLGDIYIVRSAETPDSQGHLHLADTGINGQPNAWTAPGGKPIDSGKYYSHSTSSSDQIILFSGMENASETASVVFIGNSAGQNGGGAIASTESVSVGNSAPLGRIDVTQVWQDEIGNVLTDRRESEIQLLQDGQIVRSARLPTVEGRRTHAFTDLPLNTAYTIQVPHTNGFFTIYGSDTTETTAPLTAQTTSTPIAVTVTNTRMAPGKAVISGVKHLEGRSFMTGDAFSFTLKACGDPAAPLPEETTITVNPKAGNTFSFGEITFRTPGQYRYTVSENRPDDALPGITYDPTLYRVTIAVTEGTGNRLDARICNVEAVAPGSPGAETDPTQPLQFTNTFSTGEIACAIRPTVTLQGRPLVENEFTFRLEPAGSAPWDPAWDNSAAITALLDGQPFAEHAAQPMPDPAEAPNAASGDILFGSIPYTARDAGPASETGTVYRYTIRQIIPVESDRAPNVSYSEAVKTAYVHVYIDASGLVCASVYGSDTPFANAYTPGSLHITKRVTGAPAPAAYTLAVTGPDNYSTTFSLRDGETKHLEDLSPGVYTVSEADADVSGYIWTVTGTGDVTVEPGQPTEVTVTNRYAAIPPETPPEVPPETPPETPEIPPEIPPETPPAPPPASPSGNTRKSTSRTPVVLAALPDPNEPTAPETVTVCDEDIPTTYIRVPAPDEDAYIYIPTEEIPLTEAQPDPVPATGDASRTALRAALTALAGAAFLLLWFPRKREA